MRLACRIFAATCIILTIQSAANAQQVCTIIAHYFVSAPAAFIAERGAQLGPGHWKSNNPGPNASCYIRESRSNEHKASCIINKGASADTITNYGKTVERDVDSCLRQIPNGSKYEKTADDDNSEGVTSHTITWENDADDADYIIRLSGNRDTNTGELYNAFSVSWEKK